MSNSLYRRCAGAPAMAQVSGTAFCSTAGHAYGDHGGVGTDTTLTPSFLRWLRVVCAALMVAAVVAPASGHQTTVKSLKLLHPHAFEPAEALPPAVPVYMVIENSSAEPDRLIAVQSEQAATAVLVDGTTAAAPDRVLAAIDLPPNAPTVLGPKSAHVLLRDFKESLEGYEYFPLTLVFEKAGKVDIEVFVESRN